MPGLETEDGNLNKLADISVIPYPPEVVSQMLAAYNQEESVRLDVHKSAQAYRAGWRDRSDRLVEYLNETRDKELG